MSRIEMLDIPSDVIKAVGYNEDERDLYLNISIDDNQKRYIYHEVPKTIYVELLSCQSDLRNGYNLGNAYQLYWENNIDGKYRLEEF
jgi:hypothetical protein